MIAHVRGKISEKFNGSIIIDVNGLGYELFVSVVDFDLVNLGESVKFYTYHHVREQSEELFGFSTLSAKKIFEMLISVQGVGPKAALAILSLGNVETVRSAIANSNAGFIQKASGVGKKTADRVVVDLHDKVGLPTKYENSNEIIEKNNLEEIFFENNQLNSSDEAVEALMALGYTLADASEALKNIDTDLSTAERVTKALRQ